MTDDEIEALAREPEIQRMILLWEEGLLCSRCRCELQDAQEIEYSICHDCVRIENEANGLPDVLTPDGPLPF